MFSFQRHPCVTQSNERIGWALALDTETRRFRSDQSCVVIVWTNKSNSRIGDGDVGTVCAWSENWRTTNSSSRLVKRVRAAPTTLSSRRLPERFAKEPAHSETSLWPSLGERSRVHRSVWSPLFLRPVTADRSVCQRPLGSFFFHAVRQLEGKLKRGRFDLASAEPERIGAPFA